MPEAYKDAGVDVDAADELVKYLGWLFFWKTVVFLIELYSEENILEQLNGWEKGSTWYEWLIEKRSLRITKKSAKFFY